MNNQVDNQNTSKTQPEKSTGGLVKDSSKATRPTLKRKKTGYILAVVILLIVWVGVSVAGYTYINNQPEKVLADALTNSLSDITEGKPMTALGTYTVKAKNAESPAVKLTFNTKSLAENSAAQADAVIDYGGKTYNLKADVIAIGNQEYYFKIVNLKSTVAGLTEKMPVVDLYAASLDPIITKIDGKWVKVTNAEIGPLTQCANAVEKLRLSESDQKQLKKIFKENQFIVASEKLKSEQVEGEESFHYKVDLNEPAAKSFTAEAAQIYSLNIIKTACNFSEPELNPNKTEKPEIELWIGKESRRISKIKVNSAENNTVFELTSKSKANTDDVKIAKPTDSISVTELMAEFEKLNPQTTTNLQTL